MVIVRSVSVEAGAVGVGAGLRPGYASDNATYFSSHTSSPRCVTMMVAPSAGSEIHEASLDQPHGEEDQPEAQQVAEQHPAEHRRERDAGHRRDDPGGEEEVDEHEGDAVGRRPGAVGTPDHGAHGDHGRGEDDPAPGHVLGDVELGSRSVDAAS